MKGTIVSFDVDGTLVKPEYNELVWFKEIPELYAKKYKVDFEKAKKLVIEEYEKVGENDIKWYMLDYWLKYFGFEVSEIEVLEKYAKEVRLYPEVIPVLDLLKGKDYMLIIASAMSKNFIEVKLKGSGIYKYFKKIFSAVSDYKMIKKEKKFYQKICEELEISPSSLIHIGDNYEADYLAPSKIGVRAFYLNRTNSSLSTPKSYEISTLEDLIKKLKI